MPYTKEHKERTRTRIVEAARRLFNRHRFNGVSIDEIMAEAGLTRGGFYNHFRTKDELYAEVVTQVLHCDPSERNAAFAVDFNAPAAVLARQIVTAYLSQAHLEDREGCCPLVALPSDIARGGKPVRNAYAQVLERMIAIFEKGLGGTDARGRAMAIAALCVGGMVTARAVGDPAFAQRIRRAARELALAVGGWDEEKAVAAE